MPPTAVMGIPRFLCILFYLGYRFETRLRILPTKTGHYVSTLLASEGYRALPDSTQEQGFLFSLLCCVQFY